jgi:hypothetical protein
VQDSEEKCTFVKNTSREVEDAVKSVTEYESSMFNLKTTKKTYHTVHEWFWKFEVDYKLLAFAGSDPTQAVVLQKRHGVVEIVTNSADRPAPDVVVRPPIDVNITWLVDRIVASVRQQADSAAQRKSKDDKSTAVSSVASISFSIDRYRC